MFLRWFADFKCIHLPASFNSQNNPRCNFKYQEEADAKLHWREILTMLGTKGSLSKKNHLPTTTKKQDKDLLKIIPQQKNESTIQRNKLSQEENWNSRGREHRAPETISKSSLSEVTKRISKIIQEKMRNTSSKVGHYGKNMIKNR